MAKIVYHWKDPGPLARWTLWAVAGSAAVNAAFVALDLIYRPDLAPLNAPPDTTYDTLTNLLTLLWLAALIPGCMWLYRVGANARSWEPSMKHSPASAFVWFAVPVAHLFMPYRVLSEIFTVSRARSHLPLIIFWMFNVISLLGGYVLIVAIVRSPALEDTPLWADIVSTGVSVAMHPFFAWMVISLTKAQQDTTRIAEAFDDEALPQPA